MRMVILRPRQYGHLCVFNARVQQQCIAYFIGAHTIFGCPEQVGNDFSDFFFGENTVAFNRYLPIAAAAMAFDEKPGHQRTADDQECETGYEDFFA